MSEDLFDSESRREIVSRAQSVFELLKLLGDDSRIETINQLRLLLHKLSPFASEPVDCVLWVRAEQVQANDYNPNSVAPPEMRLLEHSIQEDGYTQPVVAWLNGSQYEVVDGFHRNRVARESKTIRERVHGYSCAGAGRLCFRSF